MLPHYLEILWHYNYVIADVTALPQCLYTLFSAIRFIFDEIIATIGVHIF